MSNYQDIYTTLSYNPSTQDQVTKICQFLHCRNQMDPLKEALWKKGSRINNPGAFPFDDETCKIYDTLWKAAEAEHYSTTEKIGRWILGFICPPAEDEGKNAFNRKPNPAAYNEPLVAPTPAEPEPSTYEEQPTKEECSKDIEPEDEYTPRITENTVIDVSAAPQTPKDTPVSRKGHKKLD